mmetsp:Transcript_1583/g.3415  ORF Transcript_1583/g.3415 Transcript_1583/m.3415 type:complete len:355 (+) Transcript_1583:258-1322(+)
MGGGDLQTRRSGRGHPHRQRAAVDRAYRCGRGQASHGAEPQRPGSHRRAAVDARGGVGFKPGAFRAHRGDGEPSHQAHRPAHGGRHASAARAACPLQPLAPLPRCRPPARRASPQGPAAAAQHVPPRLRRPRGPRLRDRPVGARRVAPLRRRDPELDRHGVRSRLHRRVPERGLAALRAHLAAGRGRDPAQLAQGCEPGRRLLDRLLPHAPEEEPRRARAPARQGRAGDRPRGRLHVHAQGPAPVLQQGPAGGQGGPLRHPRHGPLVPQDRRGRGGHDGAPRGDAGRRVGARDAGHRPGRVPRAQGRALPGDPPRVRGLRQALGGPRGPSQRAHARAAQENPPALRRIHPHGAS